MNRNDIPDIFLLGLAFILIINTVFPVQWLAFNTGLSNDILRVNPIDLSIDHLKSKATTEDEVVHTIEKAPPNRYNSEIAYSDTGIEIKNKDIFILKSSGGSMIPVLGESRHKILVTPAEDKYNQIIEGDIVVWFYPGTIDGTLHRVIWRNETHVETKGDNNIFSDGIIPLEYVRYILVGIIY